MASIGASTSQPSCQNSASKCCSCAATTLCLDGSALSIRMTDGNSYENTPSPSSIGSASSIERSPKYRQQILSSTLKNDHSLKRRSRYNKLFNHSRVINRQYMIAMTNVLFQMQKELYRLKRRTHRVEQVVTKQTKTAQPIIRIPRLTEDQLSTICIDDAETISQENQILPDNDNLTTIEHTVAKTTKPVKSFRVQRKHRKNSTKRSKNRSHTIWINNRQKSIDPNRYCSKCKREFSKRANLMAHIKRIHHGDLSPLIPEEDQSLSETSENEKNEKNLQNKSVSDQPESEPLQVIANQCDSAEFRLRTRALVKSTLKSPRNAKVKCDICDKLYGADYLKKHRSKAHGETTALTSSCEIYNNSDQLHSVSDKPIDDDYPSNENPTSTDEFDTKNASTPAAIIIAEMDTNDEPIRFRADSNKTIVLAVTCLESYQLELIEQFLEKFSSHVCQTTSIDSRTTHLIANDEQQSLRSPLSMKLIEAIAHHCFCVSFRWILDCVKYDRIIDEAAYEIEGDNTEPQPHDGPRRSRLVPNRHSLFHNICFMIKCTENSDIRMTNERLEDLLTTCGGQIITCVTQRLLDKYQIIVLCDMHYVSERRHNYDQCRSLGIHFVSSDWVLESILEYRQKSFSLFEEVPL